MSRELEILSEVLSEYRVGRKWLIVPSKRVGQQWLSRVVMAGTPAINVEVLTISRLALEVVKSLKYPQSVQYVQGVAGPIIIERLWENVTSKKFPYLSRMAPRKSTYEVVYNAIKDLRLAGVVGSDIDESVFEVASKGREIRTLLKRYEEYLVENDLIDDAEVYRIAIGEMQTVDGFFSNGDKVILSDDLVQMNLERSFVESIPKDRLIILPSAEVPTSKGEQDSILSHFANEQDDADDSKNNTAAIFSGYSEPAEIKEIMRNVVSRQTPLDEIEILYTDEQTYLPLVYEFFVGQFVGDASNIPITFASGIPIRYSRPGRALKGWIDWVRSDYEQLMLIRLLRDGLLKLPDIQDNDLDNQSLADILQSLPIYSGRNQYQSRIREGIKGLPESNIPNKRNKIAALECLDSFMERLLDATPDANGNGKTILNAAKQFINKFAHQNDELDGASLKQIVKEINSTSEWHEKLGVSIGNDIWAYLNGLPDSVSSLEKGPMGGCVYVAPMLKGGYSGRKHTYIVGLDDSRFPGVGLQDPMLLDEERARVSEQLPTAAGRLKDKSVELQKLFARITGNLTLSYSCYDIETDKEKYASSAILSAYRVLSGNSEGDHDDLASWIGKPAGFVPSSDGVASTVTDWLLRQTANGADVDELIETRYSDLHSGLIAESARNSSKYSSYDGFVSTISDKYNPFNESGVVISASRLEVLGSCPLKYFFKHILKLEKPDEPIVDTAVWLDPLAAGSLLHDVFFRFMKKLTDDGKTPGANRDEELIMQILHTQIAEYRGLNSPYSESLYERQVREFEAAALIFLAEEEAYFNDEKPEYFEAAFGMPGIEASTKLETDDPVPIKLKSGRTIRVRAQVDRIDSIGEGNDLSLIIWDYKTGGTYKYDKAKSVFDQGRIIQNVLYAALVNTRLHQSGVPGSGVLSFGYFFPGIKGEGKRIGWSNDELDGGLKIVENLCMIIENGTFIATDDSKKDCFHCDYVEICGNAEVTMERSKYKLENSKNEKLSVFKELRNYE